jgi:hypothetical protein
MGGAVKKLEGQIDIPSKRLTSLIALPLFFLDSASFFL